MTSLRALLGLCLCLCACQPGTLCDPGQHAMGGGCYPATMPAADSGEPDDDDTGPAAGSCSGGAYDGFKASCTKSSDCGCHASTCAVPLNYCTKVNCDPSVSSDCPPGWTCLMIPAGMSPDPNITTICFAP